ncbi:tetratricopeptide repeat protein [Nonomuraea sp. PA05]|uniref:tetratricopeptide repeat protein n=1 Tax=Nonomuraea sp. PA05 TaxID=2604466 RepID=UPI0011DAAD49|nr:tetratricopeptide repeat protein [Nonomuraea sp. PA05]TYB67206.1 tetratricopeptide repeat protein [Nonomuraea sp. PA05]
MRAFAIFAGIALIGAVIFTIISFTSSPATRPAADQPRRETLQERLKRLPGDYRGWAELGLQYVDQARVTGDPAFYTKAEGALATAAKLNARDDTVLTGQAALAAGRHEFKDAVRLAESAIEANSYSAPAYGVLADARTQLGDLKGAQQAVDKMLGLRPGVAAFARASYAAELRGDRDAARKYLEYAHADAWSPADLAYSRYYLGELALHAGDLKTATGWYTKALQAYPAYTPALAGQARAAALGGRLTEALDLYDTVVKRLPLPQYLIEQGETRIKAGQPADWTLLDAQRKLFQAAGVRDDLTWAEFLADHGDAEQAVRHARAEYARNPNLVAADALAWALFKSGKPEEALRHAKEATATGWQNPLITYHRARIEQALGRSARVDPGFDPTLSALARFS